MKAKETVKNAHQKMVVPIVDLILGKTMSKKLLVFFVATMFIIFKHIEGTEWIEVAKWYFGAQGAVDVAEAFTGKYKRGKTESDLS